jgi:hypothetical protein
MAKAGSSACAARSRQAHRSSDARLRVSPRNSELHHLVVEAAHEGRGAHPFPQGHVVDDPTRALLEADAGRMTVETKPPHDRFVTFEGLASVDLAYERLVPPSLHHLQAVAQGPVGQGQEPGRGAAIERSAQETAAVDPPGQAGAAIAGKTDLENLGWRRGRTSPAPSSTGTREGRHRRGAVGVSGRRRASERRAGS